MKTLLKNLSEIVRECDKQTLCGTRLNIVYDQIINNDIDFPLVFKEEFKEFDRIKEIFEIEKVNDQLTKYLFLLLQYNYYYFDQTQEKLFYRVKKGDVDGFFKRNEKFDMIFYPFADDENTSQLHKESGEILMHKLITNIDFIIELYNNLNNECSICCSQGFDMGVQAQFFICGKYDRSREDKICNQIVCSACIQQIIKEQFQPVCIGCNNIIDGIKLMDLLQKNNKNYYENDFKTQMKEKQLTKFMRENDALIKSIFQYNKIFDVLFLLVDYLGDGKREFKPHKSKTDEIILDVVLTFHKNGAKEQIMEAYQQSNQKGLETLIKQSIFPNYVNSVDIVTMKMTRISEVKKKKGRKTVPKKIAQSEIQQMAQTQYQEIQQVPVPMKITFDLKADLEMIKNMIAENPDNNYDKVMGFIENIRLQNNQLRSSFYKQQYFFDKSCVELCKDNLQQLHHRLQEKGCKITYKTKKYKNETRIIYNSFEYGEINILSYKKVTEIDEMRQMKQELLYLSKFVITLCMKLLLQSNDPVLNKNYELYREMILWKLTSETTEDDDYENEEKVTEVFHFFCNTKSCQEAFARGKIKKIKGKNNEAGEATVIGKCDTCLSLYCLECHEKITQETRESRQENKIVNYILHIKQQSEQCNAEDLETVKYLKESTKNCPRCKAPVQKMSGCNQVCCFAHVNGKSCGTVFDYQTMKINTNGIVHTIDYREHILKNIPGLQREFRDQGCIDDQQMIFNMEKKFVDIQMPQMNSKIFNPQAFNVSKTVVYLYKRVLHFVNFGLTLFDSSAILRYITSKTKKTIDAKEIEYMKQSLFKEYRRQEFNNQYQCIIQEIQIIAQGFLVSAHQNLLRVSKQQSQNYLESQADAEVQMFTEYVAAAYVDIEKLKNKYGYVFKFEQRPREKSDDEIYEMYYNENTLPRSTFDEIVNLQRRVRKMIDADFDRQKIIPHMKKMILAENTSCASVRGLRF